MARKSSASVSVVAGLPKRPRPPARFGKEESKEWREIVNRLPWDWFTRENQILLEQYCRMSVRVREIEARIKLLDIEDKTHSTLCDRAEKETRMIATLATRMRLTQQSRYNALNSSTASKNAGKEDAKPWQKTG